MDSDHRTTSIATDDTASATAPSGADDRTPLVADELLVEEISIDGMCGVY